MVLQRVLPTAETRGLGRQQVTGEYPQRTTFSGITLRRERIKGRFVPFQIKTETLLGSSSPQTALLAAEGGMLVKAGAAFKPLHFQRKQSIADCRGSGANRGERLKCTRRLSPD